MNIEEKIWQKLDRAAIPGPWLTVIGDAIEDYRREKDAAVAAALAELRGLIKLEFIGDEFSDYNEGLRDAVRHVDATIAKLGIKVTQ